MFCQNCGNAISETLNYCNRCGARVRSEIEKVESKHLAARSGSIGKNLAIATGFIGFAGVVALATIIIKIIEREYISNGVVALVFVFAALIFAVLFTLVRQINYLSNSLTSPRARISGSNGFESLPKAESARFDAAQIRAASVTEHTTKNLEAVPNDK